MNNRLKYRNRGIFEAFYILLLFLFAQNFYNSTPYERKIIIKNIDYFIKICYIYSIVSNKFIYFAYNIIAI